MAKLSFSDSTGKAPGRVNLIGEHTDYNFGRVLPAPLAGYETVVTGRVISAPGMVTAISTDPACEPVVRPFGEISYRIDDWSDYVIGCVDRVARINGGVADFLKMNGLALSVDSNVPPGKGLSSSAALLVSTLRMLDNGFGLALGDDEIARLAFEVEHDYKGLPCGIMDQYVCALGRPGQALLLDTRDKSFELIDLPPDYSILVIDSGERHNLPGGDSGYSDRVRQCRDACRALGLPPENMLRDVALAQVAAIADPLIRARARHVVTEDLRVAEAANALRAGDMERFGTLWYESHESQSRDYHVSTPRLDEIVRVAAENDALGARLTGGGFGGCALALVKNEDAAGFRAAMKRALPYIEILANPVGNFQQAARTMETVRPAAQIPWESPGAR